MDPDDLAASLGASLPASASRGSSLRDLDADTSLSVREGMAMEDEGPN